MKALFDYDSLIYIASYRIVNFTKIRTWFKRGRSKAWMETEILNLSINRLHQMTYNVFDAIEEVGINITDVAYYITYAKNPKRKVHSPDYKKGRKKNKWVGMVRKHLIETNFAEVTDEWEADDMIMDEAKRINDHMKCIIISPDKDLKQIHGIHFNYGKPRLKDKYGNKIETDYHGFDIISKNEAKYLFWFQMLMGDSTDGITGIIGVGKKGAAKCLDVLSPDEYEGAVRKMYIEKSTESEYNLMYFLLKLGTGRKLINHFKLD